MHGEYVDVCVRDTLDAAGCVERELPEMPRRPVERVALMAFAVRRAQPAVHERNRAVDFRVGGAGAPVRTAELALRDDATAQEVCALANAALADAGAGLDVALSPHGTVEVRLAGCGCAPAAVWLLFRSGPNAARSARGVLGFGAADYRVGGGGEALAAPFAPALDAGGAQLMELTLNRGAVTPTGSEYAHDGCALLPIGAAAAQHGALLKPSDYGERVFALEPARVVTHVRLAFRVLLDGVDEPAPFFGAQRVTVMLRLHFAAPRRY